MHTLQMTGLGLLILALFMGAAWLLGSPKWTLKQAARTFIPIWLLVAAANMVVGMVSAGIPFLTELLVLVVVFGVPAAVAVLLGRQSEGTGNKP